MSKWSKYYTIVQPTPSTKTIQDSQDVSGGTLYNSHSWYQRLVQGSSTRMTRYREYDGMDNDVDVARALDTISEEMTQMNRKTKLHVDLVFDEIDGTVPNTTAVTLSTALRFWCKSHNFDKSLFNIARNAVKYGDCFFRKGPSPTRKWEFIHAKNVIACVVDANDITNIVAWQIRKDTKQAQANLGGIGISGQQYESEFVPADEIVRFTLNDDMSETAPFGESILKPVYRSFKQKELLEDAIIIYRISRAPERRVFYIDTGKMPPQRTKQYLEQVKNEIKQKKIPTQNGAGDNQVESIYNPHSTSEDFFFAQRCLSLQEVIPLLDGRTLTLSQLIDEHKQGKQNFVYSVDQKTGKFIPGEIEWAGVTRKNAELVEVLLDNGEKIVCTPDHKFVLRDGSEIEAQVLDITFNLMCSTTIDIKVVSVSKLNYREDTGCLTIKDPGNNHNFALASGVYVKNSDGKGSRVETLPGGCFAMDTKIPLLDGRTLTIQEIADEHKQGKQNWAYSVDPLTGEFVPGVISWAGVVHKQAEVYEVELDNGNKFVATGDHKFPVWGKGPVRLDKIDLKDNLFSFNVKQNSCPLFTQVYDHKTEKWELISNTIAQCSTQIFNCSLKSSNPIKDDLMIIIRYVVDNGTYNIESVVEKLNNTLQFIGLWRAYQVNNNISYNFSYFDLIRLLNEYGYDSWEEFKSDRRKKQGFCSINTSRSEPFNHKIVRITKLDTKIPVGTLTIDKDEIVHGFHTFAINSGVYTFNSGLGELSDLEYFQARVYRGLRIPTSYMSTSSKDQNPIFNDGRIGQAYIEELRFAEFCMRLQRNIESVLDEEFKHYLRALNIDVDPSIFRLKLPEPTNFGIYKQQEADSAILSTLANADSIGFLAKRFVLARFGQLEEEEILRNERLKCEEMNIEPNDPDRFKKIYGNVDDADDFGGLGDLSGGDLGGEMSSTDLEPPSMDAGEEEPPEEI